MFFAFGTVPTSLRFAWTFFLDSPGGMGLVETLNYPPFFLFWLMNCCHTGTILLLSIEIMEFSFPLLLLLCVSCISACLTLVFACQSIRWAIISATAIAPWSRVMLLMLPPAKIFTIALAATYVRRLHEQGLNKTRLPEGEPGPGISTRRNSSMYGICTYNQHVPSAPHRLHSKLSSSSVSSKQPIKQRSGHSSVGRASD